MTLNGLARIYQHHRQALFTLALSITGCESLADDCIQQAFLRLQRTAANPQGDAVAYMFRCVRNAAIDCTRRISRHQKMQASVFNGFVPPPASSFENPDARTLTRERDQILRRAINELRSDVREIVLLKTYSELTFKQISNVLDVSEKTAATQYRRALITLSQKLKGQL